MGYNLCIEIEAENKDKMNNLLKHIYNEITEGPGYVDMNIEASAKPKNGWLEIKKEDTKGRYKWKIV